MCAWINGWVNNRKAGDLRSHRAHYDVTVMCWRSSVGRSQGPVSIKRSSVRDYHVKEKAATRPSYLFIIIVHFMMSANIRIRFGLQIVLVCLYSTPISLSSLCKLIWRHWTYEMPVRYILSNVWVRLSLYSPLSIIQYVGLYVFNLPIPLVMIERIYILCLIIIIQSEVWTITHCLGLDHETMVSAVCLSIFF